MDGSSAVKEQQEHPIDGQYLAEFEYRARKRPGNRPGKRPGRPDDDYDDDNYDEENGDYKDNGDDDDNGDENTSCKKCGVILSDKGGRVVNGKTVKPLYKYPWIANNNNFFNEIADRIAKVATTYGVEVPLIHDKQVVCGGALISKKFILTAGHCVFNQASLRSPKCQGSSSPKECYFKPSEFSSKLLERQRLGKPMRIKKIIPHPKFNYVKMVNDIALLELQQPVKCSGKTSPICVPTKKDIYKMGQKVYVAGWGKNMETGFSK
ncbi:serine protease 38 [Trichonephila clavata]|uniref:Serine protease 38 n=1 Tax=Trichonephila clavata TaxID=2740835 RepID=A0A8X6GMR0_TRICU|nr:serine protease 38 [Trichonephila clavata]